MVARTIEQIQAIADLAREASLTPPPFEFEDFWELPKHVRADRLCWEVAQAFASVNASRVPASLERFLDRDDIAAVAAAKLRDAPRTVDQRRSLLYRTSKGQEPVGGAELSLLADVVRAHDHEREMRYAGSFSGSLPSSRAQATRSSPLS